MFVNPCDNYLEIKSSNLRMELLKGFNALMLSNKHFSKKNLSVEKSNKAKKAVVFEVEEICSKYSKSFQRPLSCQWKFHD